MVNILLARFAPFTYFTLCAALIVSCRPSGDTAKQTASPSPSRSPKQLIIPDGWVCIPQAQKPALGELLLVRNDNAASMIVRELKPLSSAKNSLAGEDICILGNISMQGKLGNTDAQKRILRSPSAIENGRPVCVYIYSENSLLRRVLVFRSGSAIYEVELLQESDSLSFSSVVEAQTAFAKSLMNGE
jgi:hypothetical protein